MNEVIIGVIVVVVGLLLRWVLYERYRDGRPNKTFFDDKKRHKRK